MEVKIPVKEIMTRAVVSIDLGSDVPSLAKKLLDYDVGSIIVTDGDQPVGIVTERDIVKKIVSRKLRPDEISIKELMTTPLITIPTTEDVTDAMFKMVKLKIRRLPVVERAKLVGIVTEADLLAVSVDMGSIFSDLIKLHRERIFAMEPPQKVFRGICEECGDNVDNLTLVDGKLICESCKETLE